MAKKLLDIPANLKITKEQFIELVEQSHHISVDDTLIYPQIIDGIIEVEEDFDINLDGAEFEAMEYSVMVSCGKHNYEVEFFQAANPSQWAKENIDRANMRAGNPSRIP